MIQRYDLTLKKIDIEMQELRSKDANFDAVLKEEKDKFAEVENEKYKIKKGLEYVEFQLSQKDKKIEGLMEIVKGKISPEKFQEVMPATELMNKKSQTDLDGGYLKLLEQSHHTLHQASSTQFSNGNIHG